VLVLYPNTKLAGGPTGAQHVVQVPEPDALYTIQETADTPAGTRELILVIRTPGPMKINGAAITTEANASSGARIFPVLKMSGAAFATALFEAKRATPSMTIAALDTSRASALAEVPETGAKYWHEMGLKRLLGAQGAYKGPPPPTRFSDAIEHFETAFKGGHIASATRLGFMHEYGIGVPVALPEAKTWYDRAAARGDTEGMVRLARLLLARDGKADQTRGYQLLQQAAAKSEPIAYRDLVAVYDRGKAVPRDGVKAADAFVSALAAQDWTILEDFTDYSLPVRKAIQSRLKSAGHYAGAVDGLDGEAFRLALGARVSAIRKTQR
jgi:Sel1 repeat